jgi:hypothetical protein
MNDKLLDIEVFREALEIQRIGNRAVHIAQAESRKLGIPNVYCFNGPVYYELSNGELSLLDPYTESTH